MSTKTNKDKSSCDIPEMQNDDKIQKQSDTNEYLQQLSESERQTYEIANQHLESSFSIEKSIGYLNWKK